MLLLVLLGMSGGYQYLGEALASTLSSLVLATSLDIGEGSLDAVNPLASLETLGNGLL